ncbi:phospho-N-acetylmuramoyl-pentapeptide-transferase homolog [Bidens hawaiensis]|uniref:phospho-N-acetylmuramoyl-pentapeptide- transferase homolog n=1 Tax=Bidens hawaiensis TaxID=980011 RepID=UPI00404ACEC2
MDWDSVSSFSLDDRADTFSASEGEESDGDIILNPITEVDIPTSSERFHKPDDALTATAYELRMIGRSQKKSRIKYGMAINNSLVTFLTVFLLLLDSHAWRIVRLPLPPFHLICPFTASTILVSFAGYICVPLFRISRMQMLISKWPARHSFKKGTTTMGGLFLIPTGVVVAEVLVGFSSIEVAGVSIATLAFATIGLIDDFLCLVKRRRVGLSPWIRVSLEVAVGTWFYFWLCARNIASPYSMKMVVPLPLPLGLVCMGGSYLLLTSFCFVSMANGMELTDGLDGLAGGTAALSFIGMSIAVLPICSDLAVFGASMAGACVGFLFHNHYKASVFMGDTGALALGGALAAMAASTGMFFPLLISSGVIVMEALSVLLQVSYFKTTKRMHGIGRRLFRMVPLHYHLESCGIKEPVIVAGAYVISCMLMLYAGYVGLVSV